MHLFYQPTRDLSPKYIMLLGQRGVLHRIHTDIIKCFCFTEISKTEQHFLHCHLIDLNYLSSVLEIKLKRVSHSTPELHAIIV